METVYCVLYQVSVCSLQLDEGGVGIDGGVVCVKNALTLRECIDRNLAFKPKFVEDVVNELSERLAVEDFMRKACSTLQDHEVQFFTPMSRKGHV